ncbi:hypothetical protein LQF12_03335 [Ruania suaedae]|uniref:FtsX-like permease family protein n=1 Tax=Ruania suaedae TaxID=2897774 RepID=UPI001E2B6CBA|nr:FtsX-like permease family protein [Ruania suaedae]UFU03655.1 hypothetical protein LQF12_03335 [Ruania suaedae]
MRAAFDLWLLLRRRSAGAGDPQRLTAALAVLAFAVTTAVAGVVLGGLFAFIDRGQNQVGPEDDGLYIILAATASALLMVPLVTLGGAAARLAVARRDERLAALRLAGATTGQVSLLTILDATGQALLGALIGTAGTFALIPLVLPVSFQGDPFSYGELVPPWWVLLAVIGVVGSVALFSAGASLRKVAITPLGVAARTSPSPLHWSRVVPLVVFGLAFAALWGSGLAGLGVMVTLVVGGFAMMNLLGPWVMGLIGRFAAWRARTPATLIAARRIIDSPQTAWRSVGGVALATFIAGMTAVAAMFGDQQDQFSRDMSTGGFLTLAIAGLVAAVSTGVMQAGRVIDQAGEYRAPRLAGTDRKVLTTARLQETVIPLAAAVGLATASALVFMLPALGFAFLSSVPVLIQFALSVAGACALVLLGAVAAGRVVRIVLV